MIQVSETQKYNIDPKKTIERAFEGSYVSSLEKMPSAPPDYLASIWGAASVLLVAVLYYITAIKTASNGESNTLWYALSAVCVAIPAVVLAKLWKSHKDFKKASGGEDKKEVERKKFYALMKYESQPAYISAAEFTKEISPMLGKQSKELYNSGVRRISEYLANVNNPEDMCCKLLTPFGDVFNQAKKRFYLSIEEDTIRFTDFDFANPKGEITCSAEDIISFGPYAKYPQNIAPAGGKIKADALILEVQDSEHHLYFEFLPQDVTGLKKLFSGKKEVK